MGTYKFIPHTADEQFLVEASDLNDAFATSVKAFYEIILGDQQVGTNEKVGLTIEAPRLRTLLYDFLNELIFYYDDQDLLLQHVQKLDISFDGDSYVLHAELQGEKKQQYDIRTEIKSMTYSDMEINEGEKTTLSVVVDI